MKTAMQELIYNLDNTLVKSIFERLEKDGLFNKALEKEKEQIIDAYKNGYGVSFIDGDNRNFSRPQEYYNQTYNN
jgi:hypothetical protein